MRRTLAVLVTAAAFLVPASAASADVVDDVPDQSNASCSNGKGGNLDRTGAVYNLKGNVERAKDKCGVGVVKVPNLGQGFGSDGEPPRNAT